MRNLTHGSFPFPLMISTTLWCAVLPGPFCGLRDGQHLCDLQNWPRWRRWYITTIGGILVLNSSVHSFLGNLPPLTRPTSRTFSSSAPSNLLPEMMDYFGFGQEVATLTVSLFISGYCLGPLLWGPLSEDVSLSSYPAGCVHSIHHIDRSPSRLFNRVPV
jgi:hypothetical protein